MKHKTVTQALLFCSLLLLGCICFTSCAEDQDDYFNQLRDGIAQRDKDDADIRAQLKEEIEKLRSEVMQKISQVEDGLNTMITNGESDVLDDIQTRNSNFRSLVGEKYDEFAALIDEKFKSPNNALDAVFNDFDIKYEQLQSKMEKAISGNDSEMAGKISILLGKMDEMKSKIQSSKNQIQQLETLYADILSQVDILEEFEQRIAAQETRYAEMLTSLPSLLDAIHQQALQLAQVKIQELTEAEEQAFADKLAEMNDQLTIMQNWFAKYQELQDQTDDLLGRFESVSNDANDLQTVIDEVNDAYTHYSDAEQILDRLDALDDIDDWESIYDDLNGQLEDAYNEFSSATNGLDFFLDSAVEPTHAEAESYYNDLEAALDDCQSILDDMHSRFDDIPFP